MSKIKAPLTPEEAEKLRKHVRKLEQALEKTGALLDVSCEILIQNDIPLRIQERTTLPEAMEHTKKMLWEKIKGRRRRRQEARKRG